MPKKDKCPECPKCLPGWLVQFGDLMSLLLTFFILLLSMAVMDIKKVEEYFDVMRKAMGFLDKDDSVETQTEKYAKTEASQEETNAKESSESEVIVDEVMQAVKEINEQVETIDAVQLVEGKNEFTLDIPTTIIFEEGKYNVEKPEAKEFIKKIARVIRTMPYVYDIEIIGHSARRFDSNSIPRNSWDLAALRAVGVVTELIKNKIDPSQLKASSFANYRPKSEVASENRRVEMKFFSRQNSNQNVLEEENFFDRIEE